MSLTDSLRVFNERGEVEYTRLVPDLTGVDPDDSFSTVPYGACNGLCNGLCNGRRSVRLAARARVEWCLFLLRRYPPPAVRAPLSTLSPAAEKGFYLLAHLQSVVGRAAFDAFAHDYIQTFKCEWGRAGEGWLSRQ